jgi:hypothetical protein
VWEVVVSERGRRWRWSSDARAYNSRRRAGLSQQWGLRRVAHDGRLWRSRGGVSNPCALTGEASEPEPEGRDSIPARHRGPGHAAHSVRASSCQTRTTTLARPDSPASQDHLTLAASRDQPPTRRALQPHRHPHFATSAGVLLHISRQQLGGEGARRNDECDELQAWWHETGYLVRGRR